MTETQKPWGTYKTLYEEDASFLLKKIKVKPNSKLSLQGHEHRSEYWVIISGKGKVVIGDDTIFVATGSFIYIPKNVNHRITNECFTDSLVFVEVQVGSILKEDDIVRYEDDYGRL